MCRSRTMAAGRSHAMRRHLQDSWHTPRLADAARTQRLGHLDVRRCTARRHTLRWWHSSSARRASTTRIGAKSVLPAVPEVGEWTAFYAEHFDTVELNVTFYRMPKAEEFRGSARRGTRRLPGSRSRPAGTWRPHQATGGTRGAGRVPDGRAGELRGQELRGRVSAAAAQPFDLDRDSTTRCRHLGRGARRRRAAAQELVRASAVRHAPRPRRGVRARRPRRGRSHPTLEHDRLGRYLRLHRGEPPPGRAPGPQALASWVDRLAATIPAATAGSSTSTTTTEPARSTTPRHPADVARR